MDIKEILNKLEKMEDHYYLIRLIIYTDESGHLEYWSEWQSEYCEIDNTEFSSVNGLNDILDRLAYIP